MKLRICEKHGVAVSHTPKAPGKASMEKEEAIAIKLQEKIASLNAELVSEEEKNKVVPDTNIFGKPIVAAEAGTVIVAAINAVFKK